MRRSDKDWPKLGPDRLAHGYCDHPGDRRAGTFDPASGLAHRSASTGTDVYNTGIISAGHSTELKIAARALAAPDSSLFIPSRLKRRKPDRSLHRHSLRQQRAFRLPSRLTYTRTTTQRSLRRGRRPSLEKNYAPAAFAFSP